MRQEPPMQYPPSPLCQAIPWTYQLAGVYSFSPLLNIGYTLVVEHVDSIMVMLGTLCLHLA